MRKIKNILENSLLWSHLTKSLKMFYTLNSEKRFFCEKKILIIHSKVECKNSIQHRKYLIENFMRLKLQLYKIWFGTIYRYIYIGNLKISSPLIWGWILKEAINEVLASFLLSILWLLHLLSSFGRMAAGDQEQGKKVSLLFLS